jgi:hypothetical protein
MDDLLASLQYLPVCIPGGMAASAYTIVCCSLYCCTALMVAMPLIMGHCMSVHNNAMRKAAWTHYGEPRLSTALLLTAFYSPGAAQQCCTCSWSDVTVISQQWCTWLL